MDTDLFIHLGDGSKDFAQFKELMAGKGFQFVGISGNCDYDDIVRRYKIFYAKKRKFLITHGHNFFVDRTLEEIKALMVKQDIDIAFVGHTHIPMVLHFGDRMIINPGSVSRPRQYIKQRSYARLLVPDDYHDYASPQIEFI